MDIIGIALYYLFDLLTWAILIRSFMTWIPNVMSSDLGSGIYNFLCKVSDPIEAPIRSIMYKYRSTYKIYNV